MKEVWKDIPNYEGLYQLSNLGNARSLNRYVNHSKNPNFKVLKKGKTLSLCIGSNGYINLILSKNNKTTTKSLHKLIAKMFLPNPNNYPCVNHINGIKTDNRVENLEWCSFSHNSKEAFRTGLSIQKRGKENPASKKVIQYDLDGNFLKEWGSLGEIQRKTKLSKANVSKCCQQKKGYKTVGGFVWKFKEEDYVRF